jgi:PKD repeat protein
MSGRKFLLPILALLFLSGSFICKKESTPGPMDFSYTGTLHVGYPVAFHTNAKNCAWTFGDGSTSADLSPVHSYFYAGSFSVTLTIDNDSTKKSPKS